MSGSSTQRYLRFYCYEVAGRNRADEAAAELRAAGAAVSRDSRAWWFSSVADPAARGWLESKARESPLMAEIAEKILSRRERHLALAEAQRAVEKTGRARDLARRRVLATARRRELIAERDPGAAAKMARVAAELAESEARYGY